ncbi:hypothetical protein AB3M89_13545 [Microbacterium sp. 179-I 3D2 NHS]|uniref:hypothetical protein n=1 Tax=Microbacterium sp. 179-I 3D2 NHS TaxID=3235178 RepID=UPI0039A0D141
MVDARLRAEWLGQMRFDDLSDAAWRVFTTSLMWCVNNGTDGEIPKRYTRYLHPEGVKRTIALELVKAGLWSEQKDRYVMPDWDGALGQSTHDQIEKYRSDARLRQQKRRERAKQRRELPDTGDGGAGPQTESVTEDVTRDVTQNVGIGTGSGIGTGEGYEYRDLEALTDPDTGEVTSWPTVPIPEPEVWGDPNSPGSLLEDRAVTHA